MTPKKQILKTKFKELESMLDDGILRGPETQSYEDIKQKFELIGNLVLAETNRQNLHHISQRFESMKESFNERDTTFTTFSNPEFDKDSISNSNSSSCSITQFCLNGDEVGETLDESEMIVLDDPEKLLPKFVGEKGVGEFRGNGVDEISEKINVGSGKIESFLYQDAEDSFEENCCLKDEEKIKVNTNKLEKRKSELGKNCCVLVSGIIMGMVLMGFIMVNLSGCFEFVEQTSFVIPPT